MTKIGLMLSLVLFAHCENLGVGTVIFREVHEPRVVDEEE